MMAGKDFDWIIAEKVLGFKRIKHTHPNYQGGEHDWIDGDGYDCPTCGYDGLWGSLHPKPYSQTMDAAMHVVSTLSHKYGFSFHSTTSRGFGWMCRIYSAQGELVAEEISNELPHAICLAALKTIEKSHD